MTMVMRLERITKKKNDRLLRLIFELKKNRPWLARDANCEVSVGLES